MAEKGFIVIRDRNGEVSIRYRNTTKSGWSYTEIPWPRVVQPEWWPTARVEVEVMGPNGGKRWVPVRRSAPLDPGYMEFLSLPEKIGKGR